MLFQINNRPCDMRKKQVSSPILWHQCLHSKLNYLDAVCTSCLCRVVHVKKMFDAHLK